MRLPRAAEYAVRCVLYLSGKEPGIVIGKQEIAEQMDIPREFLTKIAQQLHRAGIIEVVQGAKGGYRLLNSPDRVSLLQAVEAVIGEIFLNDCIIRPGSCGRSGYCSVHRTWEKARRQLRETLNQATFAKLLQEESCLGPAVFDSGRRKKRALRPKTNQPE